MMIIPFVPAGTVVPYGLSKYRDGYRLRLPLPWVYYGRRYNIITDARVNGWWNIQILFRWMRDIQREPIRSLISGQFGRLAFVVAYVQLFQERELRRESLNG